MYFCVLDMIVASFGLEEWCPHPKLATANKNGQISEQVNAVVAALRREFRYIAAYEMEE